MFSEGIEKRHRANLEQVNQSMPTPTYCIKNEFKPQN